MLPQIGGRAPVQPAMDRWALRARSAGLPCYDVGMPNLTISLKRTRSEDEQTCGVCGAAFIPLEDSGCRVFSATLPAQEPLTALLCGGCHSKWAGGTTVTLRVPGA